MVLPASCGFMLYGKSSLISFFPAFDGLCRLSLMWFLSLLWHMRWRYEAPIRSTTFMVWSARAWPPESPWIRCRSTEAGRGAVGRHERMWWILMPVSNVGLLVLFLNRSISQGLLVRSLDSLMTWTPVRAPDEILHRLITEAFLRIVLPLWLQSCGLIHMFSASCGACFPPRLDPDPRWPLLVGADCLVRDPGSVARGYVERPLFVGAACLVRGPGSVVRGYAM
ncbi:hypothetical protein V6N11_035579 [Hibiscus sabdariffa]|uniref:Uncharacterized protein n=2 Tax=Hibiscus sabdariffa TaxID=183260 RepID=A0ABR1ZID2_9ROSI